jgi:hypothetical protein
MKKSQITLDHATYEMLHDKAVKFDELADQSREPSRMEQVFRSRVSGLMLKLAGLRDVPEEELRNIVSRVAGWIALGKVPEAAKAMMPYRVGQCGKCEINLYSPTSKPADVAMPCGIPGCAFEKGNPVKALTERDFGRMIAEHKLEQGEPS